MAQLLLALSIVTLTLSGCAPMYRRVRPDIEFHLRDNKGAPVKNATAVITTRANPHDRLRNQESFISIENGVISIDSRRRWELVNFMPHGSDLYFWPWCVQAPGYQRIEGRVWGSGDVTIDGHDGNLDRSEPLNLVLENSNSPSDCFLYPKEAFR